MKKGRIFWGILFILGAAFLIIDKLGYFPDVNVLSLLLTVGLIAIIVKSMVYGDFAGILFPIAFICIIYSKQLGITNLTPWTVLIAALLGSIGLSMIFHKQHNWVNKKYNSEDYKFEKIDIEDSNYVKYKNSFSASIKYINTNNFEQADFECHFGTMKIYFDNAVMSKDNAIVRINASFSGIELYIPKTWNVEDRTNSYLSGISEKNTNEKPSKNTLTLVGDIYLSGVEIIYV